MKIIDCITFFDNNFIFDVRYNILKDFVDYFVICESNFNHKGLEKKRNFILKDNYDQNKIKYLFLNKPFPKNNNPWKNQAIQREYILENLNFADDEDYIFFSDPDEIPNPEILSNFSLKKKYGIFFQDCFNYKFNLYNPFESPWEGTRVAKKKDLNSINFMRQKIKSKNLNYSFLRFDKEKNIEIFRKGGWHFNNLMTPENISIKLKTFAHIEFAHERFSSVEVIREKINNKVDLFERGHKYKILTLDRRFPKYILDNKEKFKEYIISS